ncbi:hypothetical protein SEVIR_7G005400v4 [Setaria viridis]|uniref:Ubiquitin-like protease family profile domain-containing protein n=1 Tax=Setaria viridis TaxID=4556 RepID=A0A4U6TPE9_SETVI|nr:hypothetical protein SEVIR_7G005400v2 [Setaria viridis]
MALCNYNRFQPTSDTSPILFKSNEITSTVGEIANGVLMGRSLDTIVLHIGTCVLSQDPYQKRKKIMSPWVGILFPIHQGNDNEQPQRDGHWFTIVVNMEAKKFQIIDSLRAPGNAELREKQIKSMPK